MNVQANQKIDTVESSLNKELDGFQSEIDQKFDNLQCSISRLASQQHGYQEEENPEGECLIDTILGELNSTLQIRYQKERRSRRRSRKSRRAEGYENFALCENCFL